MLLRLVLALKESVEGEKSEVGIPFISCALSCSSHPLKWLTSGYSC